MTSARKPHGISISWLLIGGVGGTSAYNQIDYSAGTTPLTVNLGVTDTFGTVTSSEFDTDILQTADKVFGGSGADVFTRGTFNSSQFGSFAAFEGMGGDDTFTGVVGKATRVSFSRAPTGVTVDFGLSGTGTALDGFGGTDTLIDVDRMLGSKFDDTIFGSDRSIFEEFRPRGGDDFIDFTTIGLETLDQDIHNALRASFGTVADYFTDIDHPITILENSNLVVVKAKYFHVN